MYVLQLYNTGCNISLRYSLLEIFSSELSVTNHHRNGGEYVSGAKAERY